jgi:HSP20 family protein
MSKNQIQPNGDWFEDNDGQLAVDVYQTADSVIVKAPVAGVKMSDLEISIVDDVLNIKGERRHSDEIKKDDFMVQECYWGSFSRSLILPVATQTDKAEAILKNGILQITIPKFEQKKIEVKEEE